mmetsp:Transcript_9374/g.18680  ORF Transcript_9374/g.18680 Transcript_9374/m.18680 type:complete len:341 (+) Transcript_9374:52-1074(+)
MKVSSKLIATTASIISCAGVSSGFVPRATASLPSASRHTATNNNSCPQRIATFLSSSSDKDDDMTTNQDGEDLAAAFFKAVKEREISISGEDIDLEDGQDDEVDEGSDGDDDDAVFDDDDEDDDDDEEEINIPQGAVEAFIDKDAGASSISNKQIYDEMKDRMFESAGRFVAMTKGLYDEEDGMGGDASSNEYTPPTLVPDPGMSAGEVVTAVLAALRNNDVPHPNRGIETLFGFSSPFSQVSELRLKGLKPEAYYEFLAEMDESKAFFTHEEVVIAKADYSPDGTRAYITARLFGETSPDGLAVNFILSTTGDDEDDCWLVDSMRTPPPSRRGGRRNRR